MERNYQTELEGIEAMIKETCRKIIRFNDLDHVDYLRGLVKMKIEREELLEKAKS